MSFDAMVSIFPSEFSLLTKHLVEQLLPVCFVRVTPVTPFFEIIEQKNIINNLRPVGVFY